MSIQIIIFNVEHITKNNLKKNRNIFRLPWNQQSLIGCIASRFYALLFGQSYVVLNGVFGSYFVSIVHHHNAFSRHYHALCEQLDEISHKGNNGFEAKQTLTKIIKFHTAAKGYSLFIFSSFQRYFTIVHLKLFQLFSKWVLMILSLIFPSLFLKSANIFSKAIMIQLIGGTIYVSCRIFQLDVVWNLHLLIYKLWSYR